MNTLSRFLVNGGIKMNPRQGSRVQVFALVAVVVLISLASLGPTLISDTDSTMNPLATVDALHQSINYDDIDGLRVLFAEDAIVIDNGTAFEAWNRSGIGSNIFTCQPIKFEMINIQVDGEKVFWYDLVHNDPGSGYGPYILRWNAVIQNGKIQSLVVQPLPMPDGK